MQSNQQIALAFARRIRQPLVLRRDFRAADREELCVASREEFRVAPVRPAVKAQPGRRVVVQAFLALITLTLIPA